MVSLVDAVIARLDTSGERVDGLVDPKIVWKIRNHDEMGEGCNSRDHMVIDTDFKDSHTGMSASTESIK